VIDGLKLRSGTSESGAHVSQATQIQFAARDTTSSIERAQYSVDGGDWIIVMPRNGISDAPEEQYEFSAGSLAPGEHTIAVRAYDRFENVGSAKTSVKVP
jgi:hypothetical protein